MRSEDKCLAQYCLDIRVLTFELANKMGFTPISDNKLGGQPKQNENANATIFGKISRHRNS